MAKILVIDNEANSLRNIKAKLESWGFDVETALSGEGGVESVSREKPDLILLDVDMPDMDGISTLRLIRKVDADIPVILLADYVREEWLNEVKKLKVEGFTPKRQEFSKALILLKKCLRKEKKSEKKKILIVDDEPEICKALKIRVESSGYEAILASDGDEALKKVREMKPDLILLDIMLPKMSGFKVCRMIKFDSKYKKIPVIMLTVRAGKEDRLLGIQSGAEEYITKPFSDDELMLRIGKYIGG